MTKGVSTNRDIYHLAGSRTGSAKLFSAMQAKRVPKSLLQEAQALERNIQDIRRKLATPRSNRATLVALLDRQEARMAFLIERMQEAHRVHKPDPRPLQPDGQKLSRPQLPTGQRRPPRQRVPFGQTIEPVTYDPRVRRAAPMPEPEAAGPLTPIKPVE